MKKLTDTTIYSSFIYEDSIVKQIIDADTKPLKAMSRLLPAMFFLLTLLIIIMFLSQIIRQCRREIGIVLAMGYNGFNVLALFLVMVLIVTCIASLLGIGLGAVVADFTGKLFADASNIPFYHAAIPIKSCSLGAGITILVGIIATVVSVIPIIKIQPCEAMRVRKKQKTKVPKFVEKLLSDGSPLFKFTVLSSMRNRGRFLMSIFCIAASLTVILTGISFYYAKETIITQLFDERINYDCQILLKDYPEENLEEKILEISGVTAAERDVFLFTEVSFGDKKESVLINGVSTTDSLVNIIGEDGEIISVPETGIILDKHLADRLGIEIGDEVVIEGNRLNVVAFSNHYVSRSQYTSVSQALALSDSRGVSLLVNTDNEEELIDYVSSLDGYGGATFTRLLYKTTKEAFDTYSIGVYIVLMFAICSGILIVFHMTRANMLEQRREIGIVRVMGFWRWQISFCWLWQSLIQYVLALIVGLPLGTFAAKYILKEMSTSYREYAFSDNINQYLMTMFVVLVFVLLSHFLAMLEMRRWNVSETVRTEE